MKGQLRYAQIHALFLLRATENRGDAVMQKST